MKRSVFRVLFKKAMSDPSSSFTFVMQRNLTVGSGLFDYDASEIVEVYQNGVVVTADKKNRCLPRAEGTDLSHVEHHKILDMNDEGDRWEGDVLKDKPCGWGILYDKEGRVVYNGFRNGYVNVCWGCPNCPKWRAC